METEILADLTPSKARRVIAVVMIGILGVFLIYIALTPPEESFAGRLILLGAGAAMLFLADRVWRATSVGVLLTEKGLTDTEGRAICAMEEIVKVERGAFAFKPSNGFLLRLDTPLPRAWAPGLWWRYGRRVGIGGVSNSAQAKAMADFIALKLAVREGRLDGLEFPDDKSR